MRTVILHLSIFCVLLSAFPAMAQVTITQSTFPRLASFTDSAQVVLNAAVPVPTAGADQVWDFSFLDRGISATNLYTDATDDPDFTDALNYSNADFDVVLANFRFLRESDLYEAIDADGWQRTGRSLNNTLSIPLTAFTGGANDRLDYPPTKADFVGRSNLLQFPLNYLDQWTISRYFDIPFSVTAAAFGLNQTPGFNRGTRTEKREVIGWGSLIIPQADGSPSGEIDALLIRTEFVSTDSFYLNGAPAPQALLDILGVVQGTIVDQDTAYIFYTPGFGAPVLLMEELNAAGTLSNKIDYRTQAAAVSTATQEINIPTVQTFPNPAAPGSLLTLTMEAAPPSGQLRLYDLPGRLLHTIPFVATSPDAIQIKIPDTLNPGLLLMQIADKDNLPVGVGKLQVY